MSKYRPIVLIVALAALLLVAGLAAAQSLPDKQPAAAGTYQLGGAGWTVQGGADGGDYRLTVGGGVHGTGNPCCCSFLPCVFNKR